MQMYPNYVVKAKGRTYRKVAHLEHGHFGVWQRDDDGYVFLIHSSIEPLTMGNPEEWPDNDAVFWLPPFALKEVVSVLQDALPQKSEVPT